MTQTITRRLIDIFRSVLNNPAVTPGQSFFDLGGDSMLAITLMIEIEKEFGKELSVTALYDAPTVSGLAAILEGAAVPPFSPMVLLKSGTASPPLFIVHGLGGSVIELLDLGRQISHPGPVYGLQALGLCSEDTPHHSVGDMAEYYLSRIRTIQPEGPYLLAGFSFGGLIAMDIATRLNNARQQIAMLALIDAFPHPHSWPPRTRLQVFAQLAVRKIVSLSDMTWKDTWFALSEGVGQTLHYLYPKRYAELGRRLAPAPIPAVKRVREAGYAAWLQYRLPDYKGNIVFIRGAKASRFPNDPARIFYKSQLKVYLIDSSHDEMVRLRSQDLARILSDEIRQDTTQKKCVDPIGSHRPTIRAATINLIATLSRLLSLSIGCGLSI